MQAGRQENILVGRQTVKQIGRHEGRQTGRQAERQADRQADRQAVGVMSLCTVYQCTKNWNTFPSKSDI